METAPDALPIQTEISCTLVDVVNDQCWTIMNSKLASWILKSRSDDAADRVDAADDPPELQSEEIKARLIELLRDPDALVRTCAADSLSRWVDMSVFDSLDRAFSLESDQLAKRHMAGAVGLTADANRLERAVQIALQCHEEYRVHALLGLQAAVIRLLLVETSKRITDSASSSTSSILDGMLEVLATIEPVAITLRNELLTLTNSTDVLVRDSAMKLCTYFDALFPTVEAGSSSKQTTQGRNSKGPG